MFLQESNNDIDYFPFHESNRLRQNNCVVLLVAYGVHVLKQLARIKLTKKTSRSVFIDQTMKQTDDEVSPLHNDNNQRSRSVRCCIVSIINRILILYTGLQLALGFFVADGMASDSGTTFAITFSSIGLTGCLLWVVGAIAGAIYNRWYYLLPGLIVHILLFVPLIIYGLLFPENDEGYEWYGDDTYNVSAFNLTDDTSKQRIDDDAWRGGDSLRFLRGMK